MTDKTKTGSVSAPNPAKDVKPASLPTKSTRGEVGKSNNNSFGGNKK